LPDGKDARRPAGAVAPDAGTRSPVVAAKARVPPATALPRERLQGLLETVWTRRLGVVVAPAGSGKTTLLADFAARSGVPVAWYRAESWDAADVEDRSERRQRKLGSTRKREKTVVTLAKSLPVDRARPVCEIGSGWGVSLRHLLEGGFSRVVGIEPSRHRADVVRNALGVPVHTAAFESAETQRLLAEQGPFSIILSNHALEHTYDPGQVFAAASQLQREGDHLIVAVPNQETEQVMSALFRLYEFSSREAARACGASAASGATGAEAGDRQGA